MILESANGTFGGVDAVLMRWDSLKSNAIGKEGIFQILSAFIVEDVKFRRVALVDKESMCRFPRITNAGAFTVGNADGMNGVGVLMAGRG